jgi:hypothetical protein
LIVSFLFDNDHGVSCEEFKDIERRTLKDEDGLFTLSHQQGEILHVLKDPLASQLESSMEIGFVLFMDYAYNFQ